MKYVHDWQGHDWDGNHWGYDGYHSKVVWYQSTPDGELRWETSVQWEPDDYPLMIGPEVAGE